MKSGCLGRFPPSNRSAARSNREQKSLATDAAHTIVEPMVRRVIYREWICFVGSSSNICQARGYSLDAGCLVYVAQTVCLFTSMWLRINRLHAGLTLGMAAVGRVNTCWRAFS